jgi:hypothetical protein
MKVSPETGDQVNDMSARFSTNHHQANDISPVSGNIIYLIKVSPETGENII